MDGLIPKSIIKTDAGNAAENCAEYIFRRNSAAVLNNGFSLDFARRLW